MHSVDRGQMPPQQLQESLRKQLSADPTHRDGRRRELNFRQPDVRHKPARRLENGHKPAKVDLHLATLDRGVMVTSESRFSPSQGRGVHAEREEVGLCRKLCKHGRLADAVDALEALVQRACHVPNNILYVALKRCSGKDKDLGLGKRIHALTVRSGYEGDTFLATHLIGLYASHGKLEEAMRVFSKVTTPDAYNWAAIIFAYARHGAPADASQAIRLYRQMCESTSIKPDDRVYSAVLKACAVAGDLVAGKEVHSHILASPAHRDKFVQAGLVNMYAKCGSVGDARRVLDKLPERNVVAWNAMIAGYCRQGMGLEALNLYNIMLTEAFTSPNSATFVSILQACASIGVGALDDGKQLHAHVKEQGLQEDVVVGGSLVNMYAKCGSLEDARRVFDMLPNRNVVAWNAILAGYAHQGMGQESFSLFRDMQQEGVTAANSVTFGCLLQACLRIGAKALDEGRQLHAQIKEQGLQDDVVLGASLVNMYAKCGSLEDARHLFDRLPEKNVVTWNTMLAAYAQQGMGEEALSLYNNMEKEGLIHPSSVTYICLLQACSCIGVGALHEGRRLHARLKKQGLPGDGLLGGSLVNMYAKCGSLEDAHIVFENLSNRSVVTWTAMIAGYAQQGMGQEALRLYRSMQEGGLTPPSSVTYVCLLQACANVGVAALHEGKQLHAQIKEQHLQEDVIVGGSLVNMYAKCGSLEDARGVFDRLPARNVVAFNALLAGYAQQGMSHEAFSLYISMRQEGLTIPNSVTYICMLQACAAVAALPLGEQAHAEIERQGLKVDVVLGGALVNMYAKCGSMYDSQRVFDSLTERSVEAWGALISGYARHGARDVVFSLLDRMKDEGVQPDGIAFLSVLTVCSHAGLVEKGREFFEAMRRDSGITPGMEHFRCMVDLFGRAGQLEEALQMATSMPYTPTNVVWHTLLAACWKWKNVDIGRQAFEGALSVDDKDAASYVLMSNIYASAQMWEPAKQLQARRKELGAWKKPGQSWWTDVGGVVHMFLVGAKEHPESEGIYARLAQLVTKMKKEGYVPHLPSSLLDISDDAKEAELCGHSEKLAVAHALNKTAEGTTIRIFKNLRVCEDCHTATAYISKIEKRTIICRDAGRFHVFREGQCSCGGYW